MYTPLSPFHFTDADLGRLSDSVGPTERNRPDDVAKIETALDRLGYFTVDRTQGPSGIYHSELKGSCGGGSLVAAQPSGIYHSELKGSLIGYQTDRDLARDGAANPDGPTISTMASDVTKAPAKRRREDREKI